VLENRNVEIGSIRIWNVARTIQFQEGPDYTITEIGSTIRISCVFGGLIDATLNCTTGAAVVGDYRYLGNPSYDFATIGRGYGVNLSLWSILNIYYNFNKGKEVFLSGIKPDILIDNETHTAGADISLKWSKTSLIYTEQHTTNVPTEKWSASERLTFRPYKNIYFGLFGKYGETMFKDTGETETFNTLSSTLQTIVLKRGKLVLNGFRTEVSGVDEHEVDVGFKVLFEIVYRLLRGNIEYRFTEEKDMFTKLKETNHTFFVSLQRTQF
jgi:hypothetical protein